MNIIEAIKSDRRFRRQGDEHWRAPRNITNRMNPYRIEDVLADDWELEPEPEKSVEVTRSQLANAWDASVAQYQYINGSQSASNQFHEFCERLGL